MGGYFGMDPPLFSGFGCGKLAASSLPSQGRDRGLGRELKGGGGERGLGGRGVRSGARPHLLSFHFVLPYLFSFFLPLPPFSLSPPSIGAAIKQITASDPFVIADP